MKLNGQPVNSVLYSAMLFCCAVIFASDSFSQTLPKNNSASVAGRVTYNGKGLAEVTIVATNATTYDGRAAGRAQSDQDGNYKIDGLPAGSFILRPLAQPYVLVKAEGPFEMRGQTVNLSNGEAADNINFQLIRGGVVTGRITDTDGDPVIGEQVSVTKTNDQSQMWFYETERYRTDDRGIYRIYGLEPGDYRVSVGQDNPTPVNTMMSRFGSLYAKTYYPGTNKQAEAKVLELKEGEEISNIDFVVGKLPPGFAISGQVIDNAGKPVANIGVGYSMLDGARSLLRSMNVITLQTDANGRFRTEGVSPGKYGAFAMGGPLQPGSLYSELSKFEVTNADVGGIVIKLRQGATISGIAVIENSSDPAVFALLQSFQLFAITGNQEQPIAPSFSRSRINSDGSFTFTGLSPGKIRIGIQNYPQPPKGFTLTRVEVDGVAQELVDIASDSDNKNVRLFFSYGAGSLRGRIKVEGGTLPEATRLYVTLMKPGEQPLSMPFIQVDARGQFFADNIPPGTYEVRTRVVRARENSSTVTPEKTVVTINHDVETDVTIVLNVTSEGGRP